MRSELLKPRNIALAAFLGLTTVGCNENSANIANTEDVADIRVIGNQLLLISPKNTPSPRNRYTGTETINALIKAQDMCDIKNISQLPKDTTYDLGSPEQEPATKTIVICEPGTIKQDTLK